MFGNVTALEGLHVIGNTGTEVCRTHAPVMRPGILTSYEPGCKKEGVEVRVRGGVAPIWPACLP